MELTEQEYLVLRNICWKTVFKCFNCNKTFSGAEIKSKEVDTSDRIYGRNTGDILPQCPCCNAVAVTGFSIVT